MLLKQKEKDVWAEVNSFAQPINEHDPRETPENLPTSAGNIRNGDVRAPTFQVAGKTFAVLEEFKLTYYLSAGTTGSKMCDGCAAS
jgi:hypothetical protein